MALSKEKCKSWAESFDQRMFSLQYPIQGYLNKTHPPGNLALKIQGSGSGPELQGGSKHRHFSHHLSQIVASYLRCGQGAVQLVFCFVIVDLAEWWPRV